MCKMSNFEILLSSTKSTYSMRVDYIFHCLSHEQYNSTAETLILLSHIVSRNYLSNAIGILKSNINIFIDNKEYYNILSHNSNLDDSPLNCFFDWKKCSNKEPLSSTSFDFNINTIEILCNKDTLCYITPITIERMKNALSPFNCFTSKTLSQNFAIPKWFFDKLSSDTLNNTINADIVLKFANGVGISPAYLLGLVDDEDCYVVKQTHIPQIEGNQYYSLSPKAQSNICIAFRSITMKDQNELLEESNLPKKTKIEISNQNCTSLPIKFIDKLAQKSNHKIEFLLGREDKSTLNDAIPIPKDSQTKQSCVHFRRHSKAVLNLYDFFRKEITQSKSELHSLCDCLFVLFVYFDSCTTSDILSNFNATIKMLANLMDTSIADTYIQN